MNVNDKWQHEMKIMLEVFENQSEKSLRTINECFEELNRPFDDDFRKYFMKISTQRYQNLIV